MPLCSLPCPKASLAEGVQRAVMCMRAIAHSDAKVTVTCVRVSTVACPLSGLSVRKDRTFSGLAGAS